MDTHRTDGESHPAPTGPGPHRPHPREDDRLSSLRTYPGLVEHREDAFDAISRLARRVCGTPVAMVNMVGRQTLWSVGADGGGFTRLPRSEAVCSDVVATGAPVVLPDLAADPRWSRLAGGDDAPGPRAYAGVPIIGRDGLPLGSLCVVDTRARDFDPDELEALSDLATQVVAALELRRADAAGGLAAPALLADARDGAVLRAALERGEFLPWYQPVVDMRTDRVVGVEALLRWRHPRHGVLEPQRFLAGLEAGSLAGWVARSVVGQSCRVLRDLRERAVELSRGVAVNVSGRQLLDGGLAHQLLGQLDAEGIPGAMLTVEITETAEIDDLEQARSQFEVLRRAGARVVADDFGVGWSNFARLLDLPFTGLKIDRRLVTAMVGDPVRTGMVQAALTVAAGAGLDVVAEGIETADVRDRLLEMGCQLGQGWLFAPAMAPAELTAAVLRQTGGLPVAR